MSNSNLPPGAANDPRAPYNREPPTIEKKAMAVTLDVVIRVPEDATENAERRAVKSGLESGDYELIELDEIEVLDYE